MCKVELKLQKETLNNQGLKKRIMMKGETAHLEERPKRAKSSEAVTRKQTCPTEPVLSDLDRFNNDLSDDFLFSYRPEEGYQSNLE